MRFFIQTWLIALLALLGCKKTTDTHPRPTNEIPSVVYLVYGKVRILTGEQEETVPIPGTTKLYSHYTIVCGKNSGVDILTHDGIFVRVYSETKVRVGTILGSGNSSIDSKIFLNSGKIFTIAKKLPKARSISVETPSVVAGVRGTEFMVIQEEPDDPQASFPMPAKVLVLDGTVETGLLSSGQTYIVEEGKKLDSVEDKFIVVDLTSDERAELQRESFSVASLVEERRNEIQSIIERFEQEKSSILKEIEEKKVEDNKILENQKIQDKKLLQNQKDKNTESIRNLKKELENQKSEVQKKAEEEMDSIQSSGQSELERIRKGIQR